MYLYLFLALVLGYGLGYATTQFAKSASRKALEKALADKEEELSSYQNKVAIHFQKTAELVEALHQQQDNMIAHLCEGAKILRPHTMLEEIEDPTDFLEEAPPKDYWAPYTHHTHEHPTTTCNPNSI